MSTGPKQSCKDPDIREDKKVIFWWSFYKFKMNKQFVLLAYSVNEVDSTVIMLSLIKLISHENFYRDLKQYRS